MLPRITSFGHGAICIADFQSSIADGKPLGVGRRREMAIENRQSEIVNR
jgi:hypothetical protein